MQTGHLAAIFNIHSQMLDQLEPGMHHLDLLTSFVNRASAQINATVFGSSTRTPISNRELLLSVWILLEVCVRMLSGAVLLPPFHITSSSMS